VAIICVCQLVKPATEHVYLCVYQQQTTDGRYTQMGCQR